MMKVVDDVINSIENFITINTNINDKITICFDLKFRVGNYEILFFTYLSSYYMDYDLFLYCSSITYEINKQIKKLLTKLIEHSYQTFLNLHYSILYSTNSTLGER